MLAVVALPHRRVLTSNDRAMARPDLDELIRDFHVRLLRLAYLCCEDPNEAEDIVADAYAGAWPRLASGRVEDPYAYLRRSVVNRAASWRRHRFVVRREAARRRSKPVDDPTTFVEDRDELVGALRRLPLGQRQVIVLRYLEDLTEAETARALEIPVGTVKSRALRALEALRQLLEKEPHE